MSMEAAIKMTIKMDKTAIQGKCGKIFHSIYIEKELYLLNKIGGAKKGGYPE